MSHHPTNVVLDHTHYDVLGTRVLLRVKKVDNTFKDSTILMPDDLASTETAAQTRGEVMKIGTVKEPQVKIGDTVHFQRYGAVRLNTNKPKHLLSDAEKDHPYEYWVINYLDILAIEK